VEEAPIRSRLKRSFFIEKEWRYWNSKRLRGKNTQSNNDPGTEKCISTIRIIS
jgi:hypothetical protein